MTTIGQDTPVYDADTREPTTTIPVRLPVSLLRLLEAVQSKDRDTYRNDTVKKALEHYVTTRIGRAA